MTVNIKELLQTGIQLHQNGLHEHAATIYSKIIESDANNFDANHLLGVIYSQSGDSEKGRIYISKAIQIRPKEASPHYNLGLILLNSNLPNEAINHFNQAIRLRKSYPDAYFKRAVCFYKTGKFTSAIQDFNQFLKIKPIDEEAFHYLGLCYLSSSDYRKCIIYFEKTLKINSENIDAHNNLGNTYASLKDYEKALSHYQAAHVINPIFPGALNNIGLIHTATGNFDDAIVAFNEAIKIDNQYAEAYNNLGLTFMAMNRAHEALKNFNIAIRLKPTYSEAYTNAGVAHVSLGDLEEGIRLQDKAIQTDPDFAIGYWHKGLALLTKGDFEGGWPLYEWRWKNPESELRRLVSARPSQNLSARAKRLLVWSEQGLGDDIMFSSLLQLATTKADEVLVQIDSRLLTLYQRSFPNLSFYGHETKIKESHYDTQIAIGSLGAYLCPSLDSLISNRQHQYLHADEIRREQIRSELAPNGELLCGISWKTSNAMAGKARSIELKKLVQVFAGTPYKLVSLQYGPVDDDIKEALETSGVAVIQFSQVDNKNDIDGLAALIGVCDCVVTTSNTTAHLAGALGKDTWVLLPYTVDWLWLTERTDSIWYETMRLIRQKDIGNWESVLATIHQQLHHRIAQLGK